MSLGDHPHTDPGDGRQECQTCGKYVWPVTHSCKRIPVTGAAMLRAGYCLEEGHLYGDGGTVLYKCYKCGFGQRLGFRVRSLEVLRVEDAHRAARRD
jgi:hypothetical protein